MILNKLERQDEWLEINRAFVEKNLHGRSGIETISAETERIFRRDDGTITRKFVDYEEDIAGFAWRF